MTPTQVLAGLGVVLALPMMCVSRSAAHRRAADAARAGARLMSLDGRVLVTGAVFLGVQWLVITYPGNTTLLVVVLALPDLIAAYVLTRALTVTAWDHPRRGSGRRARGWPAAGDHATATLDPATVRRSNSLAGRGGRR